MKIYLVVRWGNEKEGSDGEDTSFLIASNSYLNAARFADIMLSQYSFCNVCNYSNDVFEIGTSAFESKELTVLLIGPIIKYFNIPTGCKNWVRYNLEDEWYEVGSEVES